MPAGTPVPSLSWGVATLTKLRDRLSNRVGGQGKFWSTAELNNALNEALAVWQVLTGDFVSSATLAYTAGNYVFTTFDPTRVGTDLNPEAMSVLSVTTNTRLADASLQELDKANYGWQAVAAANSTAPEMWAPSGVTHIYTYPVFPTGSSGNLTVKYYRGDRMLVSDSDYVNLGEEELIAILGYAQWYLAFKEGTTEAFKQTGPLRDMFLVAAKLRTAKLKRCALYETFSGMARDEQAPTREASPTVGLRTTKGGQQ